MNCEWAGCLAPATHRIVVDFPDQPPETWHVCRLHDRELKVEAVRSRPKKPADVEVPIPTVVRCGSCGRVLDERSDIAVEQRVPCPQCGSTVRRIEIQLNDRLNLHGSLRAQKKTPGKGGWMLDTRSGDDYTADLAAWGKRELTKDREMDLYREVIELWDGTRIESTARLSDHQD